MDFAHVRNIMQEEPVAIDARRALDVNGLEWHGFTCHRIGEAGSTPAAVPVESFYESMPMAA
jgi:hypothetical protein